MVIDVSVCLPPAGAWVALGISLLLLGASAFVSASEFAFFSLTPDDMSRINAQENAADKKILRLLDDTERLLATILITNNFVNVTIVMLCNYFFSRLFMFAPGAEWMEFLLITVILTFLLLLFGEIMPKIYSKNNALKFVRCAADTVALLEKLFRPFASMLLKSSWITRKVANKKSYNISVDELGQALELTDTKEIKEQKNMLEGIIRFGDETVKEIMTSRLDMVMLGMEASYREVLRCIVENVYSRIPVYEKQQDDIKGVLYIKDLLPHLNKGAGFKWQTLIRPPYFVPETKKIDELLREFQSRKNHIAIVVDEFGGTSGLVTLEDILEEIVGEINDEFDEGDMLYEEVNDREYIFNGKILLTDFYKILHLDGERFERETGEADTLAGWLLEMKGEFPRLKEKLTCDGLTFEVLEMDSHRIIKVKVYMPEAVEESEK